MQIESCLNRILYSRTQGELPLQGLPTKTRTSYNADSININLFSVGTVRKQKFVGVFKEKEMFIVHKDNIEIKLNGDPMVTGTRCGEGDLWKISLPQKKRTFRKQQRTS